MGEDKIVNLFEKAICDNQIEDFIEGKGAYFLADREYGTHWFLGIWLYHIIPLLNEHRHEDYVIKIFDELLKKEVSDTHKMDVLLDHLFTFYYVLKEKRIKKNYLELLEYKIKEKLRQYYIFLRNNDKENEIKLLLQTIKFIKRDGGLIDFELAENS